MMIREGEEPSRCHKCNEEFDETSWPILVDGNIERGCYSCYLGMTQSERDDLVQFLDEMIQDLAGEIVQLRDRVQELEDERTP